MELDRPHLAPSVQTLFEARVRVYDMKGTRAGRRRSQSNRVEAVRWCGGWEADVHIYRRMASTRC
jgi:hypothetical protein